MINDIEKKVLHFNKLFQKLEDDREDFDEQLIEVPDMDLAEYNEFLEQRAKTPYGEGFSEFRRFVIQTMIVSFKQQGSHEREKILELISSNPFVLIGLWLLLSEYRWRFEKTSQSDKTDILSNIMVIAVLTNEYLGNVETAMILTSIWDEAQRSGFNPETIFCAAADMAGQRPLFHGISASEILRQFEPIG